MAKKRERFKKERTEGRVGIYYHPFRHTKEIPLRVFPEWAPFKGIILSLRPLGGDRILKLSDSDFEIIERDDLAIFYIDQSNNPHVIFPHFIQRIIPYEIEIKNKEKIIPDSYWAVRLTVNQPTHGNIFYVELEKRIDEKNILEREIKMVQCFNDLPDSSPEADEQEKNYYKRIYEDICSKSLIPVDSLTDIVSIKEDKKRYDFTGRTIYTIDSKTTKDIDDAIEVEKIGDNHYLLGIHIADVSEFIREGTERDIDARNRGTSHYLADTVIHMLPEVLSQEYCSLNENQKRLAFSVYLEIVVENQKPEIKNFRFVSSLIKSNAKLTYKNVEKFFQSERIDEYNSLKIAHSLKDARELASFFAKVHEETAISYSSENIKYCLDKNSLIKRDDSAHGESDKLIEMFMIAANSMTGEKIADAIISTSAEPKGVGVYRIQPSPLEEDLGDFVKKLGKANLIKDFNLNEKNKRIRENPEMNRIPNKRLSGGEKDAFVRSELYHEILNSIQNKDNKNTQRILSVLRLKGVRPGGISSPATLSDDFSRSFHSSIGINRYAWFTSPIRRYSDIINHRQLKAIIQTGKPVKNKIDIRSLDQQFKKANYAENNLNRRLLLFYLCHSHNLENLSSIKGVISMIRWIKEKIMLSVVWQDKYDIPILLDFNLFGRLSDDGLDSEIGVKGKLRSNLKIGINDIVEINLDELYSAKVDTDKGFIIIRDIESIKNIERIAKYKKYNFNKMKS